MKIPMKKTLLLLTAIAVCLTELHAQSFRTPFRDQKNGMWGFLATGDSSVAVPAVYEQVSKFITLDRYGDNMHIARVKKNGKYGYINDAGTALTEPVYDAASDFMNFGTAVVLRGGKWGVVDRTGCEAVPVDYDGVHSIGEDFAVVSRGGMHALYMFGKGAVTPFQYEEMAEIKFSPGFLSIKLDGRYGVIDSSGATVLPADYTRLDDTSYFDALIVQKDDRYGAVDLRNGEMLLPLTYESMDDGFERDMSEKLHWIEKLLPEELYELFFEEKDDGVYIRTNSSRPAFILIDVDEDWAVPAREFFRIFFEYALGSQSAGNVYYRLDFFDKNENTEKADFRNGMIKAFGLNGITFPALVYFPAWSSAPYCVAGKKSVEELNRFVVNADEEEARKVQDFIESLYY